MRYGLIETDDVLVARTGDPAIELGDVKLNARAHSTAEDSLFQEWIKAAEHDFSEETGRPLTTERRYYWLECFPADRKIELPRPPLQMVEAVEYYNGDGDLVSFEDSSSPAVPLWTYHASSTDPHGKRGFVELKPGYSWPTVQERALAVRITFLCGYGDTSASVPALIKSVLRQKVADMDRLRGGLTQQQPYEIPNVKKVMRAFQYSALRQIEPPRRYYP